MKRLNGDEEERRALKEGGYEVAAEQVNEKREKRRNQREREAIESSL